MKKLIVEFQSDWILSHRDDEFLPVDFLVKAVSQLGDLAAEGESLTTFSVVFDGDDKELREKILSVLHEQYPDADLNQVLEFGVTEVKEEEVKKQTEETGDGEKLPEISLGGMEAAPAKTEEKDETVSVEDVLKDIDALIGADEFKALCHELALVAPEIIKNKSIDVFTYQSYLFAINSGFGLSTYLNKLSQLITALGLSEPPKSDPTLSLFSPSGKSANVYEEVLPPVKESMEPFESILRFVGGANKGTLSVLCIDISEWMNNTESRFFKEFLRALESAMDRFIIVFRIPFVEKDVMEVIRYSLYDLVSIRTVTFPPMTKEEVQRYAEGEIARYGFTIEENAWDFFHQRISEEKSDGKFYGLNTVQKVIRELLYRKYLNNAKKGEHNTAIEKADSRALIAGGGDDLTGTEMLEKLVGSAAIKEKIEEIIAQIELSVKSKGERPCIHMRFLGNPGTGKTTVARIIGKILKERGVLRIGNFFEYAGRDFCGRYVGETAPKTASICRDAYGSVLFIDEAYSLYRGDANSRDYGREALDTLIAEMENHRSDFVVIMAGYSDDMETLMEGNIGLKSRMPYAIEFPNFTREQLGEIFLSMLNGKFAYSDDIPDAVRGYFNDISDEVLSSKEFANARFVRNLFERTWAKAAMRCQLSKEEQITIVRADFERAIVDKEFAFGEKKKTRLGF